MLFNPIELRHPRALPHGSHPALSPTCPWHGLLLEPPSPQSSAGTAASAKEQDLKIHLRILI